MVTGTVSGQSNEIKLSWRERRFQELVCHTYTDLISCISRTIRHTMIFSLDMFEKNNDECILILVIYWKKTGLVHTKISNHNIIYSS